MILQIITNVTEGTTQLIRLHDSRMNSNNNTLCQQNNELNQNINTLEYNPHSS